MSLNIRVAKKVPALFDSLVVRATARSQPTPTLSRLPEDPTSRHKLTEGEARHEVAVAYAIIAEMLAKLGIDPTTVNILVTHHHSFTRRLGDARTFYTTQGGIKGRIRISSSPLWRRASPDERRDTIIHEFAHVVANARAHKNVHHGDEWKALMVMLGGRPAACHEIDRTGLHRRGSRATRINHGATLADFPVGMRVTFHAKRRDVVGVVIEHLRKRLKIREDGRGTWTCAPTILWKIS